MLKNIPLIIVVAAALTACGGDDNKKSKSSSSAALSSTPAASSTPASSTQASSTPASSTPASSTPALSSVAASEAASSAPASSAAASSAPASKLTVNFESDEAGTAYTGTSWVDGQVTATVVTISSVTGLPANATSVKVLKVVVSDYNAVPIVEVTLPAGKTLADYNVKVDAYFPRSTLGLSNSEANYYKDFMLLAGTSITSGAKEDNPAYHSKIATDWDDIDAWQTFTLTVDATKGTALTGTFKLALGLNRPAGTNDGYYFDNIRLEPK